MSVLVLGSLAQPDSSNLYLCTVLLVMVRTLSVLWLSALEKDLVMYMACARILLFESLWVVVMLLGNANSIRSVGSAILRFSMVLDAIR